MGKPITYVGIGNDEIEAELEEHADHMRDMSIMADVSVESNVLSGCAQIQVTLRRTIPPKELHEYLFDNEIVPLVIHETEDNRYKHCFTTLEVFERLCEIEQEGE
jgi:hypothetical protein